jgi:hypothetical protein
MHLKYLDKCKRTLKHPKTSKIYCSSIFCSVLAWLHRIVQSLIAALTRLPTTSFGSCPSLSEKAFRVEKQARELRQTADS